MCIRFVFKYQVLGLTHKQLQHPDRRVTTVPMDHGREIAPSLLRNIATDISMSINFLVGLRANSRGLSDPGHGKLQVWFDERLLETQSTAWSETLVIYENC